MESDPQGGDGRVDGELQSLIIAQLGGEFEVLHPPVSTENADLFLAREAGLQRLVAIKVLRPDPASDPVAWARFEREARSIARLSHRSIPAVHRVGRLGNQLPYMVLEHVEGRSLRDSLEATGPTDAAAGRRILGELAEALAVAHAHGVIRRDVRLENVILERESGRVVLTGFAIAGVRESRSDASPRLTREGQIIGDPRYASPEQLTGETVTEQACLQLGGPRLRGSSLLWW